MTKRTHTDRLTPYERTQQIIDLLTKRPHTSAELAKATGTTLTTIGKYLHPLRGDVIHISGWTVVQGERAWTLVAQWSVGTGPDVVKPPPKQIRPKPWALTEGNEAHTQADRSDQKRRDAIKQADALVSKLRKAPAANPLQAMVAATLYAENREGL